jgi:hypothetical protein
MFDAIKVGAANKLKALAIATVIDFLKDNRPKLVAEFKKKLESDNPALPDEIEVPLEAAAAETVGWLIDKAVLLLEVLK